MADNALTRLPLVGQLAFSVFAGVVILGGVWYFKLDPMTQERDAKRTERDALDQDIRKLEVTASKLGEFQREVALLEARLETLKRILPPQKETPDLMRKIQALAAQSALSIKRFTPKATVAKEFYQEWPIDVDLDGTYHNLGMFFDRVGRLPRLVNVGNLKIKIQTQQRVNNTISASCVATTFVYVDPTPTPPGPPGAPPPGAPK